MPVWSWGAFSFSCACVRACVLWSPALTAALCGCCRYPVLQTRLAELDVFKSDAVELVASKVASLSGDIRRALQICRRAAELAYHRVHRDKTIGVEQRL